MQFNIVPAGDVTQLTMAVYKPYLGGLKYKVRLNDQCGHYSTGHSCK